MKKISKILILTLIFSFCVNLRVIQTCDVGAAVTAEAEKRYYTMRSSNSDTNYFEAKFYDGYAEIKGNGSPNQRYRVVIGIYNATVTSDKNGDYSVKVNFNSKYLTGKPSFYIQSVTRLNDYDSYKNIYGYILLLIKDNKVSFLLDEEVYARNLLYAEQSKELDPQKYLKSVSDDILKFTEELVKNAKTDLEKYYIIGDWIAKNIYYDSDTYNSGNINVPALHKADSVFKNKLGLCYGYADLTNAMMNAAGIPSRSIVGHSIWPTSEMWSDFVIKNLINIGSINHVWNEVYIDGKWMVTDFLWNCNNRQTGGRKYSQTPLNVYHDMTVEFMSVTRIFLYDYSVK